MLKRIFLGIIIILLLSAFTSQISSGVKGWRTDEPTQNEIVVTGAGVTTANVTLTGDLFLDDPAEVISITSNETETPVATSYTAATNVLLVSALAASTDRTLTVNYYADVDSEVMQVLGPFLSFFIFGGIIGGVLWGIFKGR